ncbi:MAG TPA: SusD/RagB family nutrient-binding outer membrane lipoprotein [Chitinophagaceae bacterium]|nr:SusD/RagB family nutrient-binding outer membrane lipoprotein [Chitinophagaceae bacterium]
MKIGNAFILFVTMVMVSSCTKSFLDVNKDPNSVTDAPPRTLLPNTTVSMAFANSNEMGKAAALLMQYNANTNSASVAGAYDTWIMGGFESQWDNEIYDGTLNNLGIIIDKTQAKSPAYAGIAKLEFAYTISMATDLFGDVPYSQAAQGFDANGVLKYQQPVFDAQMDIYLGNTSKGVKSLFNLVREGLADLSTPSTLKPSIDDLVYNGDLSKWTRFGNSLLLKFALQVSNKAADTTKNVINSVLAGKPFIDDINGNLDCKVPFSAANPNAYYLQDIGGSIPNTQMLSNRFLALERSLNDSTRLSKLYTKPAATFIGNDNGSPFTAPALATRSGYGVYVLGPTLSGEAPVRLVTAFRNYFILAEAALRFGTTGDPNVYYQNGIKASMKSVGMTDAEIAAYFAANTAVVTLTGTANNKLMQIITQKYIASAGNAIESYNDYRRTGYPVLTQPLTTAGDDPSTLPTRFSYTTSEGASNSNQPNPKPKTNVKIWWAL